MADSNATPLADGADAQTPLHDAAAAATTNGTDTNGSVDVEMKEDDAPVDTLPPAGTATAVAPVAATTTAAASGTAPDTTTTPGNATPPVASTTTAAAAAAPVTTTTSTNMGRTGSPRPGSSTPSRQQQQAYAQQQGQGQGQGQAQQQQQQVQQQQQQQELPTQPNAHGSPTRVYLNQNVTPHLLEGMKKLALEE
ncbi:compass complex subunit [Diplodia corticola]|uniref:Compass complex subunit n=1 Tax=Diplodia corticola TaxID=236234 RepID=A0A1J9QP83_9PEZI|nr:compass complex subunit [Diplodia corticola]OJD29858.1 compass complex subunit [Diplodia corticola]